MIFYQYNGITAQRRCAVIVPFHRMHGLGLDFSSSRHIIMHLFYVRRFSLKERIHRIFDESAEIKVKFSRENADTIESVVQIIVQAFREGKKVLLFGNGGSAADASHIAAEFVNRFLIERPPLPAIALNTDVAVLTSISNDYDFSSVFPSRSRPLARKATSCSLSARAATHRTCSRP